MLNSVTQVIDALGGVHAAAELSGVGPTAVWNWRSRGRIPAELMLVVSSALSRLDLRADPSVFGVRTPDEGAR